MSERPLVADGHLPRAGQSGAIKRALVDVAVGILVRPDGQFLLTSRPPGKVYAGYWEFPGGKLEAGESVEQALVRELHEEIGLEIDVTGIARWKEQIVDYPHALVRLHLCKISLWQGQLCMREGQEAAWSSLPVQIKPVLPGTVPVLEWLAADE